MSEYITIVNDDEEKLNAQEKEYEEDDQANLNSKQPNEQGTTDNHASNEDKDKSGLEGELIASKDQE